VPGRGRPAGAHRAGPARVRGGRAVVLPDRGERAVGQVADRPGGRPGLPDLPPPDPRHPRYCVAPTCVVSRLACPRIVATTSSPCGRRSVARVSRSRLGPPPRSRQSAGRPGDGGRGPLGLSLLPPIGVPPVFLPLRREDEVVRGTNLKERPQHLLGPRPDKHEPVMPMVLGLVCGGAEDPTGGVTPVQVLGTESAHLVRSAPGQQGEVYHGRHRRTEVLLSRLDIREGNGPDGFRLAGVGLSLPQAGAREDGMPDGGRD
jgi:hypothetical protein